MWSGENEQMKGGGGNRTDLSQRKITLPISGGFEDHMRTKRYQLIAVNNRYEVSPLYSYMETESSGTWMTKTSTLCPTKRGVRTMSIDRSRQEEKVTRPGGWATTQGQLDFSFSTSVVRDFPEGLKNKHSINSPDNRNHVSNDHKEQSFCREVSGKVVL